MLSLFKTLHVLAVGLWFGAIVFFTFAGVLMFQAFAEVSSKPAATSRTDDEGTSLPSANSRPLWLPVPAPFQREPLGDGFPDPTRKEQARAFGVAVSKLFPFYYGLQLGCGVVALATALGMARSGEDRWRRWRIGLCVLALAVVGLGWWLETVVADLRGPRENAPMMSSSLPRRLRTC